MKNYMLKKVQKRHLTTVLIYFILFLQAAPCLIMVGCANRDNDNDIQQMMGEEAAAAKASQEQAQKEKEKEEAGERLTKELTGTNNTTTILEAGSSSQQNEPINQMQLGNVLTTVNSVADQEAAKASQEQEYRAALSREERKEKRKENLAALDAAIKAKWEMYLLQQIQ